MDKVKIISRKNPNKFFEIPWPWIPENTYGPTLNDLESKADRGTTTGKLVRVRCAEIPSATLDIDKRLSQEEIFPFLEIIREEDINIRYFEKYENSFVTKRFYAQKVNPKVYRIPEDNNTNNIIYDKFTVNFSGYEDIKS